MGSCLGACAGSCAASCCISLIGTGSVKSRTTARILYFWLIAYTTILALALKYWLDPSSMHWLKYNKITENCNNTNGCFGHQIVFRMSFSAMSLFLMQIFVAVFGSKIALGMHRGGFILKFLYIPLFFVASFWIPNYVFNNYAVAAMIFSGLFLLFQIMSLIDLGYSTNEWAVEKAHESETRGNWWLYGVLINAAILTIGAISIAIAVCVHYDDSTSQTLMSVNLLLALGLMGLSVTNWCEHGALLTSAIVLMDVVVTTTFAIFSAPLYRSSTDSVLQLIISLLIAALSVGWACLSLAGKVDMFHLKSPDEKKEQKMVADNIAAEETIQAAESKSPSHQMESQVEEDNDQQKEKSASAIADEGGARPSDQHDILWFHFILFVTTFYLAMLGTSWRSSAPMVANAGTRSMWVQIGGVWATILLYGWSLIAPKILKNREF